MVEVDHFGRFDAGWKVGGAFSELCFRGGGCGALIDLFAGYRGGRLFCYIVYGEDRGNPLRNPFVKELLKVFERQVRPNMPMLGIDALSVSAVREKSLPRFKQWVQKNGIELW